MKTSELFQRKKVLSFEIFPPKQTENLAAIYQTVNALKELAPDFISVTFGALGTKNNQRTLDIASTVKHTYGVESVAHLPSSQFTKRDVQDLLTRFKQLGIDNILALRGDDITEHKEKKDFHYASDLIEYIKSEGDFNIIGACYPEGHIESVSILDDVRHLKRKVDSGCDQLISQLFFDNDYFYTFKERTELVGIDVPIQAGIMPVVNKRQIEKMVKMCGVNVPKKFLKMMERYEHHPEAMRDAGIAYAIDQIVDLITQGADGIHLYTMNNPYIAHRIYQAVNQLLIAS
ncbi:methylenetetrahydrofolate reductase [Halolactibacillus alkaliphilus]|uniref:Methylenetetrahydrofolate reductase n=1 Tax=Halolactibacillus alkaliphilus TaxID=442899 RepID=A0A511X200_9BACI|nr:methylenetetrahydrofolate reductase [NAD(P)H] [Halolactibacillus alkaliphilus]GEN56979.1 methylenetetrahydrofolate reductase [Halolactibacillus alkaliphilus]GGN71572.1 methylenetetrahydrofolate reductase [Halolactibacillus alkaliphilus]SFO84713.1 5,10-methylenetetrahydrofolate reductase (NAD(P)) [Halolactibacillus alkaliphilus]